MNYTHSWSISGILFVHIEIEQLWLIHIRLLGYSGDIVKLDWNSSNKADDLDKQLQ